MAFDIVSPDYHVTQRKRREQEKNKGRVPNDIRDGFHMAYGTVYEVGLCFLLLLSNHFFAGIC